MTLYTTNRGDEVGPAPKSLTPATEPAQESSAIAGREEWLCTSPMGWSTSGMGRVTDEADARAQYAAERERIRTDPMVRDPTYRARQYAALTIRSRIVTEWQDETP